MSKQLNVQFEALESDFRACGGIYDIDDYMDHCYASVYTPEDSPFSDVIVDLTYKQFLDPTELESYPDVFVGSRDAAINLMLKHAMDPASHNAYLPSMLNKEATAMLNAKHGIPIITDL